MSELTDLYCLVGLSLAGILFGLARHLAEMRATDRDIEGMRYLETEFLKAATEPKTGRLADHLEEP